MDNNLEIYKKTIKAIDSDNEAVQSAAIELTSSCSNEQEKARALFNFVRDQIHYSVYLISTRFEDFVASTILARKKGYCVTLSERAELAWGYFNLHFFTYRRHSRFGHLESFCNFPCCGAWQSSICKR